MSNMPERIWASVVPGIDSINTTVGHPMWGHKAVWGNETEYVRADIVAEKEAEIERLRSELTSLAIESKNRDLVLAKLEGEVVALSKLYATRACNHAWDREWRDQATGRVYRNCAICGVKVEQS